MASLIMTRCPSTGQDVSTGILADEASFRSLPKKAIQLKCPACGQMHTLPKEEAWLSYSGAVAARPFLAPARGHGSK